MASSSHTTTVTAPGISSALLTNVQVNEQGDDLLDASHLGQSDGSASNLVESPFDGYTEVSISYIGNELPSVGATGAVTVAGAVSASLANAVCTSASVTGTAGELITGEATYREIASA